MNFKRTLLSLCLLFSLTVFSQNTDRYRISGKIIDSAKTFVSGATVSLIDATDGKTLAQTITQTDGTFTLFANKNSSVKIMVAGIGFEPYMSKTVVVEENVELAPIVLQGQTKDLKEITVVGSRHRPVLRIEQGKIIFNPQNSAVSAGSNALELLKKTPGIFVDGQNNVSIGGRGGVMVMLNGRQTYMQKEELANLLKSVQATSVAPIEVINNPSAQYDAEGNGIININLTENKLQGFFVSMNNGVGYGETIKQNSELSFNYNHNKLSLYGAYNHAFGHYAYDYGMTRLQGSKKYFSPTDDTDKRKTIAGRLGMDYKINDKNSFGLNVNANTLFGPGQTITTTQIFDAENSLEKTLFARNDYYMQKANRYGSNAYYRFAPKENTVYTLDVDYAFFDGGSGNIQPNTYRLPDGNIGEDNTYHSVNSRKINIFAAALNQTVPLAGGSFKSGLKYSNINAGNAFDFYTVAQPQEIPDAERSNTFDYREQIVAAYMLYARNIGEKISLEGGLRGEYTISKGLLTSHKSSTQKPSENPRDYFNVFPSAGINYQINNDSKTSLNYAARIERPAYQSLNPFEYLLDELSYWKGNPFLSPQTTQKISLDYTFKKTTAMFSYAHTKNYSAQITDTLSTNKIVMIPRNIGVQQQFSVNLFQEIKPFRWWNINLNPSVFYVYNDIAFDQYRSFNLRRWAATVNMQNSFRLPWNMSGEINGAYSTYRLGASNELMKPTGFVDLGLKKDFFKNKLTTALAYTDIFWTNRWDNESHFNGLSIWSWGRGETRQVKLNITYKFGKQQTSARHESDFKEIERL